MWSVNAPTAYSGVVQWEVGSHSYFYPIMPNKCTIRIMADLILSKQTMSSLEIAELTGKQHAHVMRDIRNMIESLKKSNESTSGLVEEDYHRGDRTQYKYLSESTQKKLLNFAFSVGGSQYVITEDSYQDAKGEQRTLYSLNKKASILLASGYDVVLRAKIIDRWEALETGKAEPIITSVKTEVKQPTISDKMKAATWAAKFLNLNESSKLIIAKQILEPYNLPLPDYTPSKGILKSASELLSERGMKISAQVFNKKAIEKGYLCNLERNSAHGQKKRFKSITNKGLSFGENQVNPNNPKSTQPLWYENKFSELLGILGFQFMGGLSYEN